MPWSDLLRSVRLRSRSYLLLAAVLLTCGSCGLTHSTQAAPLLIPEQTTPTRTALSVIARGRVRDSSGKAIKDALIEVLDRWSDEYGAPVPTTRTDASGLFTIKTQMPLSAINQMRRRLQLPDSAWCVLVGIHAPGFALTQKLLSAAPQSQIVSALRGDAPNDLTPTTNDCVMRRGSSVIGWARDAEGKPLPGVKVQIVSLRQAAGALNFTSFILLSRLEGDTLARDFRAMSDAAGRFTLRDLPPGDATVLLSDPRYVRTSVTLPVANQETLTAEGKTTATKAATLVAKPAAQVRGRVLSPTGQPVANAPVRVRSMEGSNRHIESSDLVDTLTRRDGTFSIGGLEANTALISVVSPLSDATGVSKTGVALRAGQETDAGDIALVPGVLLGGTVREERTNAPIANVVVSATTREGTLAEALTDTQGRYQIRTLTGENTFSLRALPPDYIETFNSTQATVVAGSNTAPDFSLSQGLTLRGSARDASGKPATGATLYLVNTITHTAATMVDTHGDWILRGINPRLRDEHTLYGDPQLKVGGSWALRIQPTLSFDAAPLALTLRPLRLQDVKVRVVTPEGQPIADAQVHYKLVVDPTEQANQRNGEALSDARGEITLPAMRPEQTAELTATKSGYTLEQGGKVERVKGLETLGNSALTSARSTTLSDALLATDIVLSPLDVTVTGRVLDAGGRPALGTRIALLFPNDLRPLPDGSVLTDAQGRFALHGLPRGEIVIGAARGRAFGRLTFKGGTQSGRSQARRTVEIKLAETSPPPPRDVEAAFEQLEGWARTAKGNALALDETDLLPIANLLAIYDPQRAQRAMTGANGKTNQFFLEEAVIRLAHSKPREALEWSKSVVPLIADAYDSSETEFYVAILAAEVDPANVQRVYDELVASVTPDQTTLEAGARFARLTVLAQALKNLATETWLQALNRCVAALPAGATKSTTVVFLQRWTTILDFGDLSVARRWAAQLPIDRQVVALSELIAREAAHNPEIARQMLIEADALLARSDFPVVTVRNDGEVSTPVGTTLNTARFNLAKTLAPTNPEVAREVARSLGTETRANANLQAEITTRIAAKTGRNEDDANAVLRALFGSPRRSEANPAGMMGRWAALLSESRPDLGARGFAAARVQLANRASWGYFGDGETATYYAYAYANVNPAESRLLLENTWLRATDFLTKSEDTRDTQGISMAVGMLTDVARAMISLDVSRASEMLQFLGKHSNSAYGLSLIHLTMTKWLLSDEAGRRAFPLEPYGS